MPILAVRSAIHSCTLGVSRISGPCTLESRLKVGAYAPGPHFWHGMRVTIFFEVSVIFFVDSFVKESLFFLSINWFMTLSDRYPGAGSFSSIHEP